MWVINRGWLIHEMEIKSLAFIYRIPVRIFIFPLSVILAITRCTWLIAINLMIFKKLMIIIAICTTIHFFMDILIPRVFFNYLVFVFFLTSHVRTTFSHEQIHSIIMLLHPASKIVVGCHLSLIGNFSNRAWTCNIPFSKVIGSLFHIFDNFLNF